MNKKEEVKISKKAQERVEAKVGEIKKDVASAPASEKDKIIAMIKKTLCEPWKQKDCARIIAQLEDL